MMMYRVAASLLAAGSLSMPSAAFLQSAVKFNVRRMSYLDVMAGPEHFVKFVVTKPKLKFQMVMREKEVFAVIHNVAISHIKTQKW